MPKRMLRDWTDSERVNSLEWREEVFFTRLIMKVDDYGRFSANPKLLRSLLFPLKDGLRDTDMSRSLAACQKAGLVRLYAIQNKPLLEIVNFGQRLKQSVPKYPAPGQAEETPGIPAFPELPGSSGKFLSEEKRSGKREVEGPGKARANTRDEVIAYCRERHLSDSDGAFLWEKWEANDWTNSGNKIKDWKGTIRAWKEAGYLPSQKCPANGVTARPIQNGRERPVVKPLPGPAEYEPKGKSA
jgi:hypothetical protein